MPPLEATRKPQKENISPNKELQSSAFTIPYTYRKLFGGGMDSFHDPFSGAMIRSDQKTELQFAEGAFSLPKDPASLRKLCHSLGITPPVSKKDIPEFIRGQIAEIKDSEGNNHFENQLISLLFPPSGKEHEVINAIQAADAPENPDSCAEIEVTLNGEKLEAHAHGSYQGNNKSRIALFALLGHKPSQAFLAKWVEKDILSDKTADHHDHDTHNHEHNLEDHEEHEHHPHGHDDHIHAEHEHDHHDCGHDHSSEHTVTFNGSPEEIAQQVATVISHRLEEEAHHAEHEESAESVELSQEERIDSVASVAIAHVISPDDKDIQEAFEQVADNNYIGELNLNKKESEPLQQENEALTEHFITTLKVLREETDKEEQNDKTKQERNTLVILSLARLHNKEITLEDVIADHEYPPKDEKTAAIMLAKAIEVATRSGIDQQNLQQTEKNQIDIAIQLRQNYGVSFINYTTSHNANNPFHKIVKPNGMIDNCPDHAQETARLDQKLKESHKTVKEKLKQTYQPKRTLVPKPREIVRGAIQKKDTAQTQMTRLALETLVALGNTEASEKLQSLEKQEAWDKRFNAAAEIIHGAVLVRNETTQELVDTLMEEKFFGEITEEQMVRKPAKTISETNEKHTKTFKEKLSEVRQEKPIDSQNLALTLAKMHDPQIETITMDEKLPEYTQLTRQDVIKILALDMALQTEPNKKEPDPQAKKIARYARRINEEKGIHYVNLTMNHATALHLVEIVRGGKKVVDACPDHTPQVDKMLQKMQTVAKQQVAQFNQIPIRILPFNRLQPVRGGVVEQPKKPDQKKVPPPASEPPPNRSNGQLPQRPVIPERKERPVSFRPPTRRETRIPRKNEQAKKADVKPETKRRQQLTAFVRKVAGATGFVPSYFRKVDKPSDADFSFTVSALATSARQSEERIVKPAISQRPAVFLQPASNGRPSEGIRVVKNPREAKRVEYVATARLVKGTSAEVPRSQIREPINELGRPISVQEKASSIALTESSTATPEASSAKVRPAAERIALSNVRAAIAQETQKATSKPSEQKATESLSHEAVIIPFPTNRKPKTKQRLNSGNGAKAALVALAEKRGQLQTTSVKKDAPSTLPKSQLKPQLRLVTSQSDISSEKRPTYATESVLAPVPVVSVRSERPQLRLVKSDTGVVSSEAPAHATSSAPKDAPTVSIKPTLTLLTEGDGGTDKIPAGIKTTTNPSEATGGHSISVGKGSRRSSTSRSRTSSKRSSESSSNRGPDQPQNTLNPHDAVTSSIKKVTGQQTAKQVEQAFAKKEEQKVEQQVIQQMEQAAQTTEEAQEQIKENVQIENRTEAQIAQGATQKDKEQTTSSKDREGTNAAIEETTEDTEEVTQTATGEYAKIRKKSSRGDIATTARAYERHSQMETSDNENQTTTGQTISAPQATEKTEAGTKETGSTDQQSIAPVIPLSSRRKEKTTARTASNAATAQIAASDGHYLPNDPFGARDALRQAFAEIAA